MSYDEPKFARLIDDILRESDLNTISAKRIRKQLSERLGYDVSEHKKAVNKLIEDCFDKFHQAAAANGTTGADSPTSPIPDANSNGTNGAAAAAAAAAAVEAPTSPLSSPIPSPAKRGADDSDVSDVLDGPKPKKKRIQKSAEEDDAAFAARLQQEENSRARPTRGGAVKPVKKKAPKKKSATKVKDNSDDSEPGDEPKERKGGFHKPMNLSEPLAQLLGESQLSRPQTVKKIWEYVKSRDLQDPADRRQIRCDDAMRAVFKSDRVHMFTMNKTLNQNLYPVDEQ